MTTASLLRDQLPPHADDLFVVLDLDNTLLYSYELTPLLVGYFLKPEEVEAAKKIIARSNGQEFDTLSFLIDRTERPLKEQASSAIIDALIGAYSVDRLQQRLLMPGVLGLGGTLQALGIRHGIMTKGSEDFQRLKLALFGRLIGEPMIPAIITDVERKAAHIEASWWDKQRQRFVIPSVLTGGKEEYASYLMIIDDKVQHVTSDHSRIIGYHVAVQSAQDASAELQQIYPKNT